MSSFGNKRFSWSNRQSCEAVQGLFNYKKGFTDGN